MKKTHLAAALAAALATSSAVHAGTIEDEIAAIKARMEALEGQVKEMTEVIEEKDREIAELKKNQAEGSSGTGWFSNTEIGGLIEFEAGYTDPSDGDSSSDLNVATVELAIATQVHDWVGGEIVLLYEEEEDDSDIGVDVATITIADPEGPWYVTSGKQYVPFGTFETNLISDPLTLDLAETRETAILAGLESNGFSGGVYFFNGELEEDGDDHVDTFGVVGGYGQENDDMAFAVNVGYISNIGDTDTLEGAVATAPDIEDHVGGFTIDGMFATGPFTFIGEYTTATDDFKASELAFKGSGAEPSAFNVEAGYSFTLAGKDATVAVAYQETDEAVEAELPEKRVGAAISVDIYDNTTLSFEWLSEDDYSRSDGGTGEDADTITGQLAIEF